jgi:hypothetical protein
VRTFSARAGQAKGRRRDTRRGAPCRPGCTLPPLPDLATFRLCRCSGLGISGAPHQLRPMEGGEGRRCGYQLASSLA